MHDENEKWITNSVTYFEQQRDAKNRNAFYLPLAALFAGLACVQSDWLQAGCVGIAVGSSLKFIRDSLMTAALLHITYVLEAELHKKKERL